MKRMKKRLAAAALAVCMVLGMITTSGAYQWSYEEETQGKMIQYLPSTGTFFIVHLVPLGTEITFSESVDIEIYQEGEYRSFEPVPVVQGVTSYTISDAKHTYIATGADGGMAMFRGATSKQAPITMVGDLEYGTTTLKLSKPVADIRIHALESYDYYSGQYAPRNYLVYEVPVGTRIEPMFGPDDIMLMDIWTPDGKRIADEEFAAVSAQQFPDAEINSMFGSANLPLTLNEPGYYYNFAPEALACSLPIIKVVEESTETSALRAAEFTDMNWSAPYVEKVYAYGWMEGGGEGKFMPEGNLTVAQAVTLAARLHAAQSNRPIPTSEGAWYQSYLDYCINNYLLSNYYWEYSHEEGWLEAQMDKNATRLDMVKILSGAMSVKSLGWYEEETVTIPDLNKDEVDGAGLVYDWYRNGIISGAPGTGAFLPNNNITRGEVAVILCNLLGL